MGFLKYLDILIGLAVVMVLLSPIVTAITQMALLLFDVRAHFLADALEKLIQGLSSGAINKFRAEIEVLQNGNPLAARVEIKDIPGGSIAATTAAPAIFADLSALAEADALKICVDPGQGTADKVRIKLVFPKEPPPAPAPAQATAPIVAPEPIVISLKLNNNNEATWPISLGGDQAWQIADAVLRHPRVAKGNGIRRGEVIAREELIRVLLELAAGEVKFARYSWFETLWVSLKKKWGPSKQKQTAQGTQAAPPPPAPPAPSIPPTPDEAPTKWRRLWCRDFVLPPTTLERLRNLLQLRDIPDAAAKLAEIRAKSQDQEKDKPADAAHQRETAAIVEAAKSDFVGKIFNTFDPLMTRVTQRYALRARLVTILGALLVIGLTQMDSFHLLKRLSADDSFRNSLVTEASKEQERIDAADKAVAGNSGVPPQTAGGSTPAPAAGSAEAAQKKQSTEQNQQGATEARARLSEINQQLDKIRAPEMGEIIPGHFAWERVPTAVLVDNEEWRIPYPKQFELVLGTAHYSNIVPDWKGEPLDDLKVAINAAKAPVDVKIENPPGDIELVLKGDDVSGVVLYSKASFDEAENKAVEQKKGKEDKPVDESLLKKHLNFLKNEETFARATFDALPKDYDCAATSSIDLRVGYGRYHLPIKVADGKCPDIAVIRKELENKKKESGLDVTGDKSITLTALDPRVRSIKLQYPKPQKDQGAKTGNLLGSVTRVAKKSRITYDTLSNSTADQLEIAGKPCFGFVAWKAQDKTPLEKMQALGDAIETCLGLNFSVGVHERKKLILNSHLSGPVELRFTPGLAETNILNRYLEEKDDLPPSSLWQPIRVAKSFLSQTWAVLFAPGLILSWTLLSLGAPFWYDALKDLLKLRPASAPVVEKQQKERLEDTKKPAVTIATKA